MSKTKYDLSQVSQVTKDAYLQASIDFDCNRNIEARVRREAAQALYREAEVKSPRPKTAREILEEYIASEGHEDNEGWDEVRKATAAIYAALKVLP